MKKHEEVPHHEPPALLRNGDVKERAYWTIMRSFVPSYEAVWRIHVFPLRVPDAISLRDGLDLDFETFAQANYTAFVVLASAREDIENKEDDLESPETIWSKLQRAAEVLTKAVAAFGNIFQDCTGRRCPVNTVELGRLDPFLKAYRNSLHDSLRATVVDSDGVRRIPRRSALERYVAWSDTMYRRNDADFVLIDEQLMLDFRKVCSVFQDIWKQMESCSDELVNRPRYKEKRSAGRMSGYGSFVTTLSASASSTATPVESTFVPMFGPQGKVKR